MCYDIYVPISSFYFFKTRFQHSENTITLCYFWLIYIFKRIIIYLARILYLKCLQMGLSFPISREFSVFKILRDLHLVRTPACSLRLAHFG